MIKDIKIEKVKKITTYSDKEKKIENGFLEELFKEKEKTLIYLTSIKPGSFKGYYLHKIRNSDYVCIKGKVKIELYDIKYLEKREIILDANNPERAYIPKNIAIGLENICDEEAWLINYHVPPYDPKYSEIKEEVKYTKEELDELMKIEKTVNYWWSRVYRE